MPHSIVRTSCGNQSVAYGMVQHVEITGSIHI